MCRNGIKLSRKIAKTEAMAPFTDYEYHPGDKVQVPPNAVRQRTQAFKLLTA